MNEGTNNSVAFYAPKGKNFSGTKSLIIHVYIAARIQLVGHHYFWMSTLKELSVTVLLQLESPVAEKITNIKQR